MRPIPHEYLTFHAVLAFWICQPAALLVHEAGHVLAGLLVGRKPRRILCGLDGKFLGHFRCFGVPVIFTGWPGQASVRFHRLERSVASLWIVAAGPLAGILAAAVGIWLYFPWKGQAAFSLLPRTVPGIWMMAFAGWNAWMSFHNLRAFEIPSKVYGKLASDGLQIRRHFRPGWMPRPAATTEERGGIFVTLSTVAAAGCFGAAVSIGAFWVGNPVVRADWILPSVMLLFAGLAILMVRATVREAGRNRPTAAPPETAELLVRTPAEEAIPAYQAAFKNQDWITVGTLTAQVRADHPMDPTWIQLDLLGRHHSGDDPGMLELCGKLAGLPQDPKWAALAVECELFSLIRLGREDEWRKALESLPEHVADEDQAIRILDSTATYAIREKSTSLCRACLALVRNSCGKRPALVSLRGTLGGLLAELGERVEARRVLEQVMRDSPSLTDLSITALILAEVSCQEGRGREAARLARKSMDLDDAEWVSIRAKAVLEEVGKTGE